MRAGALFVALVLVVARAHAAEGTRVIVSLRVNRVPSGEAVIVSGPHDVYVRARDVVNVPFPRRPATRTIDGDLYESLGSSGATYAYDPTSLTLDLTYRISTTQRLDIAPQPAPAYRNGSSAAIAYAASFQNAGTPALSTHATFATPGGDVRLGFASTGGSVYRTELGGRFYNGAQTREILLGDQTFASGGVLPSMPIFGIGVTGGTLMRTSGARVPCERISGTLRNPATIEIGVSGEEPIEVGLEPGPFSIDGVPVRARVSAIDDVTHLPVRIAVALPLDPRLLAMGWHEVNFAAGVPRTCVYACATYRGLAIGGSTLTGNTPFLSSGAHAEYLDGRIGIGYDAIVADSNHALRLSVGLGPLDGTLMAYEQRSGSFSFGFGYDVNGAPAYDENASLSGGWRSITQTLNVAYRGLRFQYELWDGSSSGPMRSYEVGTNVPIFHTTLQLDVRDRVARGQTGRVSLGVFLPLAMTRWRDTTLLGTTIGAHEARASVIASQIDTPGGLEIGGTTGALRASYASDAIQISTSSAGTLAISGALAFLHGVHPVRDTTSGYAVVVGERGDLVADTNGRIHAVGSTAGSAFPLPPIDRPTGLSYEQQSVTLDSNATLSSARVYPAPGAGALVVISHARLFAVIGAVAGRTWRYGAIAIADGASSPIGSDGMFYFEGLAAGSYPAVISGMGRSCRTTLVVPASTATQIDIGPISCTVPTVRQH